MIEFGIGMGIICSIFSWLAVPLSGYLKWLDNNEDACQGCIHYRDCVAWKKLPLVRTSVVGDWMFYAFLRIREYCPEVKKCPMRYKVISFLVSIILYLTVFWSRGLDMVGIVWGVAAVALLLLSIVDWNTQYIPFEMSGIIFICGLIQLFINFSNWLEYVIGLIAVSGFLLLVNFVATPILQRKYEGEAELDSVIGDGDIKLMAATGLLLGWKLNFLALGIGCIAGSVIHLILMKIKKGERIFALGPYLSLGVYITMIYGEQLISWYLEWMGVNPIN
jgi:leader peptidase (prepilin peptidase)/N-methyltransferase